jgi:hypothetical protein
MWPTSFDWQSRDRRNCLSPSEANAFEAISKGYSDRSNMTVERDLEKPGVRLCVTYIKGRGEFTHLLSPLHVLLPRAGIGAPAPDYSVAVNSDS